MTVKKAKAKKDMGDIRPLFDRAAVWMGQASTLATVGVHAVGKHVDDFGAREAICGLKGRFLIDDRLTGHQKFHHIGVDRRCENCHKSWLGMTNDN